MAILVVGSLNMDLVTDVKSVPKGGETINGLDFHQYCGGKGANQAISIARLKGDVSILGKVGNDSYGHTLYETINDNQVQNHLEFDNNTTTGIATIIVEKDGENRIMIIHGANYELSVDDLYKSINLIENASIIISQLEIRMEVVDELAKLAKMYNKIFILNPAPYSDIKEETLKCVTYFVPNESELGLISKKKQFTSIDEMKETCHALLDIGVENVIVTLGKKGSLLVNRNTEIVLKCYSVTPIDTTGAGDCFIGAFATYLDQCKSLIEALDFANLAASLSVTKKGAIPSLPTLEEVVKFKEEFNNRQ